MKKLLTLFVALSMPAMAFAAGKAAPAPEKKGFMDSAASVDPDKGDGCGLGWQVTQKRTMIATTTRATTNGFVPPTFGMTSGTIGCEQHSFAKNEEAGAKFAYNNFDSLSIEMAEGNGEFLAAFARTLGCNDNAVEHFGAFTQKNYRSIIRSEKTSAVEMFKNVRTQMSKDAVLATQCKVTA